MPKIERPRVLRIHENDPVAVALSPLSPGDEAIVQGSPENPPLQVEDPIPFGHKIALVPLRKGQTVLKYGESIGRTTQSIRAGQHVHTHNLVGLRGRTPIREAITECEVRSVKGEGRSSWILDRYFARETHETHEIPS